MERSKSNRLNLLRKLKPQKTSYEDISVRVSPSPRSSRVATPSPPSRAPSTCATEEPLSTSELLEQFSGLRDVIIGHVQKFYSEEGAEQGLSQSVIEHASTGISLPWPQILGLLGDVKTRIAMLTMCIAWTVLSRSLLLKLGLSNSPGSTFLPPEIVECFQSFSLGKGAITLGKDETNPVNFALLSRWRQTTSSLCHRAYVENAFTFFDPRTVNIERALKDLDPLLATYAKPRDAGHGKDARLNDLREVLRHGASFAFTLFGHPAYWKFDWQSNRAIANGKTDMETDPERTSSTATIGVAAMTSVRLTTQEIVAWPSLVKIMDEEGAPLDSDGDGLVLGKKKYLADIMSE